MEGGNWFDYVESYGLLCFFFGTMRGGMDAYYMGDLSLGWGEGEKYIIQFCSFFFFFFGWGVGN